MQKHLVVTIRPELTTSPECVSVFSSNIQLAVSAIGQTVLLKLSRDTAPAGYCGTARLDGVDTAADGRHLLLFLSCNMTFLQPVPLTASGVPFESALADDAGKVIFGRHAIGMREISPSEFKAVLAAATIAPSAGFEEIKSSFAMQGTDTTLDEEAPQTNILRGWFSRRRRDPYLRNRLIRHYGAFCCLSGVSMDVPSGSSMLQVSHLHPLYLAGPDHVANAALKTPNIHAIWENGLVTVRPDHSLRFAPDIPPGFRAEFKARSRAAFSSSAEFAPSPDCLAFHRKEIFERRLRRHGLPMAD